MSPICLETGVGWDMGAGPVGRPTGHGFRVERVRGPVWYAKYRLPDGRQVQRKIGLAWTERGRPANGYFQQVVVGYEEDRGWIVNAFAGRRDS